MSLYHQKSMSERLQSPIPRNFEVPTLVQPSVTLSNLLYGAIAHKESVNLEEKLCEIYGVKHCLLLDRARTGAYLLIEALNLKNQWITTSFMHRPFSILLKSRVDQLNFVDIKTDFTIDVNHVENMITKKTEVILATHMYGKASDISSLRKVADKHGLLLIENCVHMPGKMSLSGSTLGSWGDAALLSFNVDKPLAGVLGGALLTSNDEIWSLVNKFVLKENSLVTAYKTIISSYLGYYFKPFIAKFLLSQDGKDGVREIENFPADAYELYTPKKINNIQKIVLYNSLRVVDAWNQSRINNAKLLLSYLLDCKDELILPVDSTLQPNSYLYFPIIFKKHDRYDVACRLADKGIESKWRYYPLHLQKGFEECEYQELNMTEYCWKNHLLVPINHKLSEEHICYIANSIRGIISS